MKEWLHQILRCPECLPDEASLTMTVQERHNDDIIEARLTCPECRQTYPIRNGVAILLPERSKPLLASGSGYNSWNMLSAYLWSHYGEFFQDPEATDAYRIWSSCFKQSEGMALDIGCAVGRLSFELSLTHEPVIGIDTSLSFITKARELLLEKRLAFDLVTEGLITEPHACDLSPQWQYDRTEFIVADALALPFPADSFSTAASVNVLEKVTHPRRHLRDVNRVMAQTQAMFVFADPFSWDESVSAPELWVGGTEDGEFQGRGIDNMTDLFHGRGGIFDPPLKIIDKGSVLWKIRKTENLWEYINSQYLVGTRQ